MQLELRSARGTVDARGYPLGCCGYGHPLEICTAQLSSERECKLCERAGGFPLPAWWSGDCEVEALAGASVQIGRLALPSLPWAVIAFVERRFVDPRWPIIGARSAAEAIELALARAVQVFRATRVEPIEQGRWRVGRGVVIATRAQAETEGKSGD